MTLASAAAVLNTWITLIAFVAARVTSLESMRALRGLRACWLFTGNSVTEPPPQSRPELAATRAYSFDPAFGAGLVSGLGFGAGRDTPMLSNTNPKPFLSVSRKLMVPLPFYS